MYSEEELSNAYLDLPKHSSSSQFFLSPNVNCIRVLMKELPLFLQYGGEKLGSTLRLGLPQEHSLNSAAEMDLVTPTYSI
jgi:hypothetical protein